MDRPVLFHAIVLVALAVACENAEESCNAARVSASDAWQRPGDELAPQCGFFNDQWTNVHREGLEALQGMFVGRGSRWGSTAVRVGECMEAYEPVLATACRAVPLARRRATGGAVAGRDAARDADRALASLSDAVGTFERCVARVAETSSDPESRERLSPLVAAVGVHADAVGAMRLSSMRETATVASEAAFAACRAVDP